jgi:hypothetical protein
MTDPTPPAEDIDAAESADPYEQVGAATARFGVRNPDGRLVHVHPGDPVPRWMSEVIASSNWATEPDPGTEPEPATETPQDQPDVPTPTEVEEHPGDDATVADILAWVGDDADRAAEAYEIEHQQPKLRVTLVAALEEIIDAV